MFCPTCGAEVSGAFCTKCGARTGGDGIRPATFQDPPPPRKSGNGLKILFIVLGIVMGIGLLFTVGVVYVGHKVVNKVKASGVDFGDLAKESNLPAERLDACSLLSTDELGSIAHLKIAGAESSGKREQSTCEYTLGSGSKIVVSTHTRGAKAELAAVRFGVRLAQTSKEATKFTEVSDLGDEAVMIPRAGFILFRKGRVAVQLHAAAPEFVEQDEMLLAIARKAAERIAGTI